ncbi:serine dehydratase [bacterium (Candidatus Blackallbacteria) CG17_big_fil_post_rev_8_21_14_2_50_48_46]|uniref:Serine dehydratase n=1 Tax=bacterium (Candidatus Blackallbacteria) CG17_big_fil_post_rev_8_21_14_2_50_48_46 TaxID=2014261 RepID=A0A2M7FZZ1_9BACT|nr:MAG: serine dehydratase [bacterium (Candidatus Blackallbacteria) CG18_big_fil_WC_8_21_14_2_50_49_26]PIW14729.1 MAG: serine dehydratase [bacterium (Candidatus Blackallbacteria) CG17_big_fil_post_rev_8_21_14_2_50_48_46]PIW50831.1 MAG: serine dehydratase [bacterium (Candidatus Blackallbacteria) CG13_big_fil_rev_8_21_14_2_50_49_14]
MADNYQKPDLFMLRQVHALISEQVHQTPVVHSEQISALCGGPVFFKCENLQKVGAFKFRGASAALALCSPETLKKGVTTHSSGNHAQALARAARERGIPAWIVMPENAPQVKKNAVKGYGAEIVECEATLEARERSLAKVQSETGAHFVHPYNDIRVIAGQATATLELLEQAPKLDYLLAPVGGGGLLSGSALAAHFLSPQTQVIGCEPQGADDAFRSFQAKQLLPSVAPKTICDGLLTSLGSLTFPLILEYVQAIYCVGESEIIAAMRLIWERLKLVIEPSAAVPLAVLLSGQLSLKGKSAAVILSGGNLDLGLLPWASGAEGQA